MSTSFSAFLAISLVVIITPGPDTALTIRNTVCGGKAAGISTAIGVCIGQLIWAIFTGLGVVAILLASEPVFHAVRLAGAGYLIYLGAQSLRSAAVSAGSSSMTGSDALSGAGLTAGKGFRQGILNNMTNPKMAAFFASVLPQFVSQDDDMLWQLTMLGLVFALLTLAWLTLYTYAVAALGTLLRNSRVRRSLDGIAGIALIAMGVRVATTTR